MGHLLPRFTKKQVSSILEAQKYNIGHKWVVNNFNISNNSQT